MSTGEQNGAEISDMASSDDAPVETEEQPELDSRFVCGDGACVGIIARDGRCGVCGAPISPYDVADFELKTGTCLGPEFERADRVDASRQAGEAEEHPGTLWEEPDDADEAPELESRILCSDGACIGVIGSDRLCKLCGKPFNPDPSVE